MWIEIKSTDVCDAKLKEARENVLMDKIEQAHKKNRNTFRGLLLFFIFVFFISNIVGDQEVPEGFGGIIIIVLLFFMFKKNYVIINYYLDEECENFYKDTIEALKSLDSCMGIWSDDRTIKLKNRSPSFIKSNVNIYNVNLGKTNVYFLPDRVLYVIGDQVSSFKYNDFDYYVKYVDVIEERKKFRDALLIGEKWKYETKDGNRDYRYHNNSCKPIYRYAKIIVDDSINDSFVFYCSSIDKVKNFQNQLYYIKHKYNISKLQQIMVPEIIDNHEKKSIDKIPETPASSEIDTPQKMVEELKQKQKNMVELKNEIEFYMFYNKAVRYMKIKQYTDSKAELFEFNQDGKFVEIKNKTMPILSDFLNQHVSKKATNTRQAVDLFIKFIKTPKGKDALEKWNHAKTNS